MVSRKKQKAKEAEPAAQISSQEEKQITEAITQLEAEIDSLRAQIQTITKKSSGRIGLVFAVPGALSLALSVITQSQVLAFIGLGLTFWGALFFLVRPITYVRGSLLSITAQPAYLTIDRIARELGLKGRGIYMPPYPRGVYLPEHLKGLKEPIVFIPAEDTATTPSVEELATSRFITEKPKGAILISPGSGLVDQIEKLLRTDLTKMSLEDLATSLPQLILENFQLAKEIELKKQDDHILLKTVGSVYGVLYRERNLTSVHLVGCPLTSAVASTIAKATGKPVYIESITTPDNQTTETTFKLLEG